MMPHSGLVYKCKYHGSFNATYYIKKRMEQNSNTYSDNNKKNYK